MMAISILVAAAILVTISYLALKILSGVVVTPPTPLRELSGEPREAWRLPGEKVMQLQVAPEGDRAALLSRNEADGETSLRVYSLGENPQLLLTRPVQGYRLEWLYGSPSALVYEDAGGIWRLDGVDREPVVLAAGNPDFNSDPLPSPDGSLILWKRAVANEGGRVSLWTMKPDGSGQRKISDVRDRPAWSPDGSALATYVQATHSSTPPNDYYIEEINLVGEGGGLLGTGKGEMRYICWLDAGNLMYVSMYIASDESKVDGVVYRVVLEPEVNQKAQATLRSLDDPKQDYAFFLSKERERLAYLGSSGLEFYDIAGQKVYRETRVPSFTALDWLPGGEGLIYAQDGIIYTMKVDTGNAAD